MNINDPKPAVKTSYRWTMWAGLLAFLVLFGGIGAWAGIAQLSGAVLASGVVVVEGKPKTIQHLDGGSVAEILVSNGDIVQPNDVLVRLDRSLLETNLEIYKGRIVEFFAGKARLQAERDEAQTIDWADPVFDKLGIAAVDRVKAAQSILLTARRTTRLGQIAQLNEKIDQFNKQIEGVDALKTSKADQIALLNQELKGLEKLLENGHVPLPRILALQRTKADLVGQLSEHEAERSRLKNSISEIKIQILQVSREFRQSVLTELRQVDQDAREMIQQYHATREQLERVDIRAPVAGMIHELAIFTVGGVVAPGGEIMQIISQNDRIDLEVNVETQFRDEIFVGQFTTIRLPAFNQRTTPELDGEIRSISPSSIVDEKTDAAFYKVNLILKQDQIAKLKGQRLVPGMPVEAFIQTRKRTVFSYLTKPLTDQIARAFREE